MGTAVGAAVGAHLLLFLTRMVLGAMGLVVLPRVVVDRILTFVSLGSPQAKNT